MKEKIQERQRRKGRSSLTDRSILIPAIGESFKKLDPRLMARNPVMFVVEIGSVITTIVFIAGLFNGAPAFSGSNNELFVGQITIWLWFTVLFASFAEAVAEGRGKAQAAALRKTRSETIARRLVDDLVEVPPAEPHELVVSGEGEQVLPLSAVLVGLVQHLAEHLRGGGRGGIRSAFGFAEIIPLLAGERAGGLGGLILRTAFLRGQGLRRRCRGERRESRHCNRT